MNGSVKESSPVAPEPEEPKEGASASEAPVQEKERMYILVFMVPPGWGPEAGKGTAHRKEG